VARADTGADVCIFPLSIAAALQLDVLNLPTEKISGVGNSGNTTYFDEVEIDCGFGIRFRTFAGFTSGLESQGTGLLGQRDFFENYNVVFSHKMRVFAIEVPDIIQP
jgi:hypothetical protein